MTHLSAQGLLHLRKAHKALDAGDRELAAAWFSLDLEGFVGRLAAALEKAQPVPLDPKRPKRPAGEISSGFRAAQIAQRKAAMAILERAPQTSIEMLMARSGCSRSTAVTLRKEMGISKPCGRGLREKYEALVAENPQITDYQASVKLRCSVGTVGEFRRERIIREAQGRAEQSPATKGLDRPLKPASDA